MHCYFREIPQNFHKFVSSLIPPKCQWDFQGPPIMGTPYGKRDPYYSHIFRDSNMGVGLGNSMGPAYHFRGSHVLGAPG